jgi:DNA modification methylase
MALRRTEIIIIFAFDSARRSFKWFVADCTSKCDTFLELGFAQDIRALFRTGCLSSVFEPSDVGCVEVATDNTNSLNKVVGLSSTSPCTGIRTTSDSIFGGVEKITTNNTIFLHKNLLERLTCPIKYNKGMMGKQWDSFVPGPEIWKEVYRVLKPGGHMLVFAGTRSMDLMCMALRLAGFELRDSIGYTHTDEDTNNSAPILAWVNGQGFPKSQDVSKEIDHKFGMKREVVGQRQDILEKQGADLRRGSRKIVESLNAGAPERNNGFKTISADITAPATAEAKQWAGWGSALKPSWEPIILARKPLEGTIAENVLHYATGALNIDGSRITTQTEGQVLGRFPSNVIISHHPECKFIGYKEVKNNGAFLKNVNMENTKIYGHYNNVEREERINMGVETVEQWECHEDCPMKMFPESKGQQGDIKGTEPSNRIKNVYQEYSKRASSEKRSDSGSAARFFKQCSFTEEDLCTNVNIVGNYSLLSKKVEDFVLRLVAIEDNQEDNLLKSMIQPFMNAMRKALKENCEINIKQMTFLGKKLWQDQKHIIMDLWKESPVNVVEIQKRINTTMIIQNLLSIDGFVENVISNIMLNNMVLGEAACRFKYEAKASQSDREEGLEDLPLHTAGECTGGRKEGSAGLNSPRAGAGRSSGHANFHPTVKPCSLMRYLCKLITPPNGIILDPFLGSGSTAKAAVLEGFRYVGIEMDEQYVEISRKRVAYAKDVLLPNQTHDESKKIIRAKKADSSLQQNSSPSVFDL